MSFSKTKIYNLALSHLLLARQVENADTDTTNEVKVLNTFWDDALSSTLEDLDLDSLSESIQLELLATLTEGPWTFAYKYPSRCEFLRRIESGAITDNERTHIAKRTGVYNGQKAIFTNEANAVGECIPKDLDLEFLNSPAGLAVSYFLAFLSAPLIVGKGASKLKKEVYESYLLMKSKAQEIDSLENYNFDPAETRSSFVAARVE